jgi:hypothetical protein
LAFAEELTRVRNNASKSEGLKNQRLPSRVPGICPSRAIRFTVFGCSRRNRAASMQSQTGSIVADAIFIEHFQHSPENLFGRPPAEAQAPA